MTSAFIRLSPFLEKRTVCGLHINHYFQWLAAEHSLQIVDREEDAHMVIDARYLGIGTSTIHQSLKSELAGTGQIDGAMISDVQMVDRCHTRFVTPMTSITVNWSKVGNFAARTEQGKVSIPITDDRATHIMTMPDGDDSRRVDGSMGLLADDCQS